MHPALILLIALAAPNAPPDAGFPPSVFPGSDANPALTSEIDRALSLRREGRREEALVLLETVRKQALAEQRLEIATNALIRRADVLHDLKRNDDARATYEQAYAEAEKRSDFWAMGRAAHDLGLLGDFSALDSTSLQWFKKAFEARREGKDLAGLRVTAHTLATAFSRLGRAAEAVPFYEAGIQAAEAQADDPVTMKMHLHLANLLLTLGEQRHEAALAEKGRGHLTKAIEACERTGGDSALLCRGEMPEDARRCERNWPTDTPLARALLAVRQTREDEPALKGARNGFPDSSLLLRAGLHSHQAAQAWREVGTEAAMAQAVAQDRRAIGQLMDALANDRSGRPWGMQCAGEQARELCDAFGLVSKP